VFSPSTVSATFEAPAPGPWELDRTHFPRPVPLFTAEIFAEPFKRGFQETTSRYGMLLDHLRAAVVNGFIYYQPTPAPPDEIPQRFAAAEQAFARKLWREDKERWEREAKPTSIRQNLELAAVDPSSLSTNDLLVHLGRCREQIAAMIQQHHRFNGAAIVPTGDFLVHALEWTGLPPATLLALLRGSASASAGASQELDALADAIREDEEARAALSDHDAGATLAALRTHPGRVAEAVSAYLDLVGDRIVDGLDIGHPTALERPDILVTAIRGAVESDGSEDDAQLLAEEEAAVRDAVPDEHRHEFDGLLAEARLTYGIRDERGLFSEVWVNGITRRAVLAGGERLAAAGRLKRPSDLADAGWEEMHVLLSGRDGPSADELAARAEYRHTHFAVDAPTWLNEPPPGPPPMEGLPAEAARMAQAIGIVLFNLFGDSQAEHEAKLIRGLGASIGVYEGTARLVRSPQDFDRIREGDVLVAPSTTEAFNLLLPLLGAIVTDSGGLLSHAAIVAREFGIPSVVGTREGTKLIPDGARVRVDGACGEVTLLQ
jgi:phosphohistidine swiveling domain-containing protein